MNSLNALAPIWSGDADRPVVLLMHGFGSNETDLAGLTGYLPTEFRYVSLRAPLDVAGGFAWFPLTMHGAKLAATGSRVAARAVATWCREVGVEPVGAIGFSQGGAMAIELLREAELPSLEWAAVLSGFVVDGHPDSDEPDERDARLHTMQPPVFWGRGDRDMVISPEMVASTLAWMPAHSTAQIEIYPNLMHSISPDEIADLSAWLHERLT